MRPPLKRTINTSPKSGRRFFNVRSLHRPNVRRHYVCTKPDCSVRLTRDADRFCPTHAHLTLEDIGLVPTEDKDEENNHHDESSNNNNGETKTIEDSNSIEASNEATGESHEDEINADEDDEDEEQEEEEDDDDDEDEEEEGQIPNDNQDISTQSSTHESNGNATPVSFVSKRSHRNRDIEVNETTGTRSFRDESGRRRFLCSQVPCTKLLKRQGDVFCRKHTTFNGGNGIDSTHNQIIERQSVPPETKNDEMETISSSFLTTNASLPVPERVRQRSSTELDTPKKQRTSGTHRSFRDASGRIRFLCSNPECHRRVPRQAVLFCRHHDPQSPTYNSQIPVPPKRVRSTFPKERTTIARMDVNHNTTTEIGEIPDKKIRLSSQQSYLSAGPAISIVLATTPLLDDQWSDVLQFFRRFPQVQLSTNLNVNNSTTHLLIDDSKNPLHCTITKKIVQAAVRRHVFIISTSWIRDCLQADRCVDEHPYEIKSDTHTTLRLSQQDLQMRYLFNSRELKKIFGFAVECRQCQGSINRNELIELIELAGGKLFDNDQNVDILVVLCDANDGNIHQIKEKYDQLTIPSIKYVASDFLLKSIIKFEIQDIDRYSL